MFSIRQTFKPFHNKYKFHKKINSNIWENKGLHKKLKKPQWSFLRYKNFLNFFPRAKKIRLKFFHKNILRARVLLRLKYSRMSFSSLKSIYNKSKKGNPKHLLFLNNLERRLDVCLYRSGLFTTPFEIRHHISHKNVYINGTVNNNSSTLLRKNDLVQINFRHLKQYDLPQRKNYAHLEFNHKNFSFIYLGFFGKNNLPYIDQKNLSFLNYILKR
jgi:ribosomal protein S4